MNRYFKLSLVIHFAIVFSSCDTEPDTGCICTEEFRMITVYIVDTVNVAIPGFQISFVDLQGVERIVEQDSYGFIQSYVIMNDSYLNLLTTNPQPFLVKAKKDTIEINATYYFYKDNCGCHVSKHSGLDTIKVN